MTNCPFPDLCLNPIFDFNRKDFPFQKVSRSHYGTNRCFLVVIQEKNEGKKSKIKIDISFEFLLTCRLEVKMHKDWAWPEERMCHIEYGDVWIEFLIQQVKVYRVLLGSALLIFIHELLVKNIYSCKRLKPKISKFAAFCWPSQSKNKTKILLAQSSLQ